MKVFAFAMLLALNAQAEAPAKNLIILIGDGMGPQQVGLALSYAQQAPTAKARKFELNLWKQLKNATLGSVFTAPYGALVVDSASSATQLATAQSALSETIGLNFKGEAPATILEKAKRSGRSIGLVSDTRMTHATPASFAAHVASRKMEDSIAEQMVKLEPDVMLSAGLSSWLPKGAENPEHPEHAWLRSLIPSSLSLKSERKDEKNVLKDAQAKNYALAFDVKGLRAAKKGKLLGLFASDALPDALAERRDASKADRGVPTLVELTKKSLELLAQNKKGFVLMVEAGQIDWAAHKNDAGTLLHEMLRMDETLGVVLEFAGKNKDTMVLLTADHETGGFGFTYRNTDAPEPKIMEGVFATSPFAPKYNYGDVNVLDALYAQKESLDVIVRTAAATDYAAGPLTERLNNAFGKAYFSEKDVKRWVGEWKENKFPPRFQETHDSPIDRLSAWFASQITLKSNIVWATGAHTSTPVMVAAWGPHRQNFTGFHTMPEVGAKAAKALGLSNAP